MRAEEPEERTPKVQVRPWILVPQTVQWQESLALQVPNAPVYPESQILVLLHSSTNLLLEENSIIIRGWRSRIQRLQGSKKPV